MSYDLKNDYFAGVPISAVDLNRRADILNAQLPGVLRIAGVREGVVPLFGITHESSSNEGSSLVAELGGALDSLKIQNDRILPGAALIENGDGTLVYVVLNESLPIPALSAGQEFLHLALRVPGVIGGPSDTMSADSRRGAPPQLVVSEDDHVPNALLLARWVANGWSDRRIWVAPVALARAIVALQGDLSLLQVRVATLENGEGSGGSSSGTYLSQLKYNPEDPRPAVTVLEGKLADLNAKIEALQGGNDLFPAPFDILADEIALNRAGLAEVNPHSIERGQISIIVKEAGHGQDDTPDYSPDTNDPLELPYNPETGVFGF